MRISTNPVIQGSLSTVLTLFGGLLGGLALGTLVFHVLPGHNLDNPSPLHITLASLPALLGFLVGGGAWGLAMGRIVGASDRSRMIWAGLLGFAPVTITLAVGLSIVETIANTSFLVIIPTHRLFTILFTPAAFLIASTSAWAFGRGLKAHRLAYVLLWQVGLAAGAAFLATNLVMEALGWVVGAPGAAERATMVTVLALGNIGAALAGGAVMGWKLDGWKTQNSSMLEVK